LRVFENVLLREIFGPMRDEVTGSWRKFHSEELHNFYFSRSIIKVIRSKRMRCVGHVPHMGEMRNSYKILVGKPERKRLLCRTRCEWEDNISVF
jgi:hypothetical protein